MNTHLDEILRAAGDATRLRILNLLQQGGVCVCDLQRVLGMLQPTVSRHLAVLRHAGLVTDVRNGNRVMYSLAAGNSALRASFFEFLRGCFLAEPILREDLRRLQAALQGGDCATPENSSALEWIAS